jgi:hypothetical protein
MNNSSTKILLIYFLLSQCRCGITRDPTIDGLVVSTTSGSTVSTPTMLLTVAGNIFITYETNTNIYLAIYDSQLAIIKQPFIATADSTYTQTKAELLETFDGSIMMTWSSDHLAQSTFNIFYKIFTSSGQESLSDTQLSFYSSSVEIEQSVTKTINTMILAWCHYDSTYISTFDIEGQVVALDGSVSTFTVSASNPNVITTGIKLASLSTGFVAVYVKKDNNTGNKNIIARIFNNNGQVLHEEFIVNNTVGINADPYVSDLKNSRFVVSWTYITEYHVYAKMFDESGNALTTSDINICNGSTNGCTNSKVSGLEFGGFVIAYQMLSSSYYNAYFQIYDTSSNKIIDETSINSATTLSDNYMHPIVKTDANSNLYFNYESSSGIKADKLSFVSPCYVSCAQCSGTGSSSDHLCTSCATTYYPLEDKISNCYISTQIVPNYTFNTDKFYKNNACYSSCYTCLDLGTTTEHKCLQCKAQYYRLEDNSSMCYQSNDTIIGYYFNTNIFSLCYKTCKSCTAQGDDNVHNCDTCRANYYPKEDKLTNCCLYTDIFQGYYFDNNAHLFKKCYTSCSQCTLAGDLNDNKCTICAYGYSNIEGTSNCILSDTLLPGYYLDTTNNKFRKCYSSCKACMQEGDISNHQCKECKESFYKSEDTNVNNCYSNLQNPIPLFYFDATYNIFKYCYNSCYTCSKAGDDNTHNCLTCKVDHYPLEDKNTQCYHKDIQIEGYKFTNDIFSKCDQACEQSNIAQGDLMPISDVKALNSYLIAILRQPINNPQLNSVSLKLQATDNNLADLELIENLNNLSDKYLIFMINSDSNISTDIFNIIDKTMNFIKFFFTTVDENINEAAYNQYDKTKTILQMLGDLYVSKNKDNPNLIVSTNNFEVDIFDYNKYDTNQKLNWESPRTSVINIHGCEDKLKQFNQVDDIPMSKIDIKTNSLKLNPYISERKVNVTDLITSREIKINAYDPKNGKKLDIADLCKDIPMDLDFQANEFKQYNATDYNTYKRIGIDIYDKNKFKECQSFRNNESYADFTTEFVNNLTDIAIDCGTCTYENISNSKAVKCNCGNIFDSNINIFKQTLFFSVQTTKLDIIKCVGTAFKDGETISANPSFWFIIALFIFLSTVIALSFKFHDFNRVIKQVMFFQINFKANEKIIQQNKLKAPPTEAENIIIPTYNSNVANKEDEIINKAASTEADDVIDNYKGRFLNVEMNQGTADYCTTEELIEYDNRPYLKYLKDIFITRHEIGKVFFFPDIFVPKFLKILSFAQVTSVKFALNAILYDDSLINERNSLKDNVS